MTLSGLKTSSFGVILHWDHIGSAKEIKDITGAKIALHRNEKDWLEKSLKPLPPAVTAWGHIFAKIMAMFIPLVHIPATNVDVVLGDTESHSRLMRFEGPCCERIWQRLTLFIITAACINRVM